MNDNLYRAFRSYLEIVQLKFSKSKKKPRIKKHLTLFRHAADEIEELEKSNEFHNLISETWKIESPVFPSGFKYPTPITNFLRRSGCYLEIIKGKPINIDDIHRQYLKAFQRSEFQTTYLLPLDFVYFEPEDFPIDFEGFQILGFTDNRLRAFYESEINEVFYPKAKIPLDELKYVPFVRITESIPVGSTDHGFEPYESDWTDFYSINLDTGYTNFPKSVEKVLKMLSLYEWELMPCLRGEPPIPSNVEEEEKQEITKDWHRFEVPFILEIDDYLLNSPKEGPDINKFSLRLRPGPSGELLLDYAPDYVYIFRNERIDSLKKFIQNMDYIFTILRPYKETCKFIETALNFFIKAFFSNGLEQLLWHITSLDALLGEKGHGSYRMAERLALITGKTKEQQNDIKDKFKKLYIFRCDLVHGNTFKHQVYTAHLYYSRFFARQAILWFLNYLKEKIEQSPNSLISENILIRNNILGYIDSKKVKK